jgi:translation initiation factor 4G
MCIEELNSPGSYHLIISTWVSDSFERKEMERDLLYKLLVNLCKPSEGLFSQAQLHQGYSHRFSFVSYIVSTVW